MNSKVAETLLQLNVSEIYALDTQEMVPMRDVPETLIDINSLEDDYDSPELSIDI